MPGRVSKGLLPPYGAIERLAMAGKPAPSECGYVRGCDLLHKRLAGVASRVGVFSWFARSGWVLRLGGVPTREAEVRGSPF